MFRITVSYVFSIGMKGKILRKIQIDTERERERERERAREKYRQRKGCSRLDIINLIANIGLP